MDNDSRNYYFLIIGVILIFSGAFIFIVSPEYDDMIVEKNNALETTTILIQNKITNETSIHDKIEIIRFYCEIAKLNIITCMREMNTRFLTSP